MKRLPGALLAALLALAILVPTVAAGIPVRQVALGASLTQYDAAPLEWRLQQVDGYSTQVGRAPALWAVWSNWGDAPNKDFPTAFMQGLQSRGIVPMVNWEPIDSSDQNNCAKWQLDTIIHHKHDAYIRQWATAAKNYGGRIILRFAFEMNGYWYPWGAKRCNNTAAKERKAWREVYNIFRGVNGVGATNVEFLWSPYLPCTPKCYSYTSIYPGDAYVQWAGFTAFNWGPQYGHPWRSMFINFKSSMNALKYVTTKPVIAAEMGAANLPSCGTCDKVAWINNGYPAVYTKWPNLVAIVYFDIDMRSVGQPDWRIDSPSAALDAYKQIVAKPEFQGALPAASP